MPSQAATSARDDGRHHHARMLGGTLSSKSNQDEHNDAVHNDAVHNKQLQQSIAKQHTLVAAATAKAFANRSSKNLTASLGTTANINPYVEQQQHTSDNDASDNDASDNDANNETLSFVHDVDVDVDSSFDAWENPSYFVKNLDTGESYNVDEIDQHYALVTLDAVAAQHNELSRSSSSSSSPANDDNDDTTTSSSYLLQLYTADETVDIEIEDDDDASLYPSQSIDSRSRTANLSFEDKTLLSPPTTCAYPNSGCRIVHHRASGYCSKHEALAKEREDSRAQALYLIPHNARATFVGIDSYGFVYDAASRRLFTVYALAMRCLQSGASWVVYRRYRAFRALSDALHSMGGVRVPLLPPKKLFGAFERSFVQKRQQQLATWLHELLAFDRVDSTAAAVRNPHLLDVVRHFLTSKADQVPFLLDRLPLHQSRLFGASIADDCDEYEARKVSESTLGRATLADFQLLQVIGRGSFGKVVLVTHRRTNKLYAMKILTKQNIVQRKQVEHTRTERRVLGSTPPTHPFIVRLHYAFQTPQRLYFVLDYCPGGELFYHLSRMKKLPEHMACFYAAEIVLALEHLHSRGVVYRDLKPENILLTKDGHVKLADFGLAKENILHATSGTNSLCGTPEYLPPEILDRLGHGLAVDWWNLGMVLYEMLTGLPPWYTNDRKKLFERLRTARLHFPPYVSRAAESLIRQLLQRNPRDRLGATGAAAIKAHVFFGSIEWELLLQKQVTPPFRPCPSTTLHDNDAPLNFEAEFTRLPLPSVEVIEDVASSLGSGNGGGSGRMRRSDSETFQGFTFENTSLLEAVAIDEASI